MFIMAVITIQFMTYFDTFHTQLMSACCRQIRQGCEEQMTLEELARRRQAFYISEASRSLQELEDRSTRVTTIYQDSAGLALGIYEIHVPRSHYPETVRSNRPPKPNVPPPPYPEELPPPTYDEYLKLSAATAAAGQTQQAGVPSVKNNSSSDDKQRY
ncbi:hypothetical protein Ocin01_05745 [Orchesella cincta]|uniref:Uncharacterized protein n=1 Tax=Orchesella cincta TaxID=48709 RepID=A0A1D2N6S4_ORCCI|nr:hypothetical protein Ocin01_05745 [Orchesella cincta]